MKIELINCEISVGYIGTPFEIALQMVSDAVEIVVDRLTDLAHRISLATSEAAKRFVECMNSRCGRIRVEPVRWPRPSNPAK